MLLDLDDRDVQLLREMLHSVVQDLSPEIADTDHLVVRRELKNRRDRLRAVLERLGSSPNA